MLLPEQKPDRFEKGVRFGCGVLFAVPLALYITWDEVGPASTGWVLGIAGFALLLGTLTMAFGDRFWRVILRLFSAW